MAGVVSDLLTGWLAAHDGFSTRVQAELAAFAAYIDDKVVVSPVPPESLTLHQLIAARMASILRNSEDFTQILAAANLVLSNPELVSYSSGDLDLWVARVNMPSTPILEE